MVAIVALGAFTLWASATTNSATNGVRRASMLSDAYQRARYAVAEESLLLNRYRLTLDPSLARRIPTASSDLDRALTTVSRFGDRGEQKLVRRIRIQNTTALVAMDEVMVAARAGDPGSPMQLDQQVLEPVLAAMTTELNHAAGRNRTLAMASLHRSQTGQRIVLLGALITFALGLLLTFALIAVLRLRGRLERARRTELERLKRASLFDSLTGLPNNRSFHEDLERVVAGAQREPLTLVLFDLDELKRTNDTHGHQAGDECITTLAHCLAASGDDGTAYRIGGDEFALIVKRERASNALFMVQRLQSGMLQTPSGVKVTATAGMAEATEPVDRHELIRQADLALVQARRVHRRTLVYSRSLEPILAAPDREAEQRHAETLATALARAVDAKDPYTHSHCETVSELCALIGEQLRLDPERIAQLRFAGLLHDVGKIGITDAILQKPGPLDAEEQRAMRGHSQLGYDIVCAADRPVEATWIRHHHERIDGSGYPDGLAGDDVPLESRVILVADAFEAMTADRPYRAHREVARALAELERCSGTQFDADCVTALRAIVTRSEQRAA
jgi:diguanylate cyclase (GGDEF)-like protein